MTDAASQSDPCLTHDRIEAYLRGQLSATLQQTCEAHLKQCETCRRELDQHRADNALLAEFHDVHKRNTTIHANAAPASDDTPITIDGFEILGELHTGGQGTVYKARQLAPNRTVALKVLRSDMHANARDRTRFQREIELAAALHHPNIVTVYETGTCAGRQYFAMEYVDGHALDKHLEHTSPTLRERVELFVRTCRAVQTAHQRGVIHRDLKPGNVLVDTDGGPHVLDFGVAKPIDTLPATDSRLTFAGEFVGTLAYASPEQVGGDSADVDVRSDVYSLGVLGYEMLAGRMPYKLPADLGEAIRCIRETSPAAVKGVLDDDLAIILQSALAKDKERRYPSAEALANDLQRYLDGHPIDAKRDSVWYVLRLAARRHRTAVGAAIAAVLLLATFSVSMTVMYRQEQREAQRALRTKRFLLNTLSSVNAWSLGPDATLFETLDRAERAIETELAGHPDITAELRYTIGLTYASVRRDTDAARHLRAAHDFYLDTSKDAERLATCRANLGRITGDIAMLRQAVADLGGIHGSNAPATLLCNLDLAEALAAGTPEQRVQAGELLTHTEERIVADFGKEHRYTARCLRVQGWLRVCERDDAAAWPLYEKALTIYRSQDIPDPRSIELYEQCAALLVRLDRIEDADKLLGEAADALPPVFGRDWLPRLQWRRGRLALQAGDADGAVSLFREALGTCCLHVASNHPHATSDTRQLALLLLSGQDRLEPITYVSAFRGIWLAHAGEEDRLTRWACDLAAAFHVKRSGETAREILVAVRELGRGCPRIAPTSMQRLTNLLDDLSRPHAEARDE